VPSQGLPGVAQIGSAGVLAVATHTVAPGDPTQAPLQQSSGAEQAAPAGAQASRHANPPAPSGRQRPPQHCSATEQGKPTAEQLADVGRHRICPAPSAPQRAPVQHSSAFMQISPSTRHLAAIAAGAFAQRPTPSGPTLHTPEQQVAPVAQRSCSGWQPLARTHRLGPFADGAHRPEQQSLFPMHSSSAGRQPGND